MRITGIRARNFKSLQDFEMADIPGFAVLFRANGTGKSTFMDVFDFLKDCLQDNVRTALQRRGGFSQVISRGRDSETIVMELRIAMSIGAFERDRTVTYRIKTEERVSRRTGSDRTCGLPRRPEAEVSSERRCDRQTVASFDGAPGGIPEDRRSSPDLRTTRSGGERLGELRRHSHADPKTH